MANSDSLPGKFVHASMYVQRAERICMCRVLCLALIHPMHVHYSHVRLCALTCMHMYMLHASAALNQEGLEYVLAAGAVTHRVDASERECTHVGMAAGHFQADL